MNENRERKEDITVMRIEMEGFIGITFLYDKKKCKVENKFEAGKPSAGNGLI